MGSAVGFLAIDDEASLVCDWFERHPASPQVSPREDGHWYHFPSLGSLAYSDGQVDVGASPLVYVVIPERIRGVLWTAGEVGFTPTPLRQQYPALYSMSRSFRRWLGQFHQVFSYRDPSSCAWTYFLEGHLLNHDMDVFALPSAYAALQAGQYFLHSSPSEREIEVLCNALRLRGVECS